MASQGIRLATGLIYVDEAIYPRGACDAATVTRYARALEAGRVLPPIVVGKRGDVHVLLDGRHRLRAHQQRNVASIEVEVSEVPEREFFAEAVRRNAAHGTPLTAGEIVEAARRLARQGWVEADIAKVVALSVADVRQLLVTGGRRMPPAARAQRTFGSRPVSSTPTQERERVAELAKQLAAPPPAPPIAAKTITIDKAMQFLGEEVLRGALKTAKRHELESWLRRAEYLREAIATALQKAQQRGAA